MIDTVYSSKTHYYADIVRLLFMVGALIMLIGLPAISNNYLQIPAVFSVIGICMVKEKITKEEYKVSGEEVLAKIKELITAGNIRRIIIKNDEHKVILEIPLTFAVVGAVLAPVLAAVGAMAALLTKCTIVVERTE